MKVIKNQTFDSERAFYESSDIYIKNCKFQGTADGESAFKESKCITVENCFWDLRYPFWHDETLNIKNTVLTENCRAALWYSKKISVESSKLHGIKALRECSDVSISDCSISSPEFGWFSENIKMKNTKATGEYFMLRSRNLDFTNISLNGKYSFQYATDAILTNCVLDTKDAFWHAKNITVKNSIIKGEYLAWYSENITFENCIISGTQPLCYCKNLKLTDCEMHDADLCFEKSQLDATITTPVISIKNPLSGYITLPHADEVIGDTSECKITLTGK